MYVPPMDMSLGELPDDVAFNPLAPSDAGRTAPLLGSPTPASKTPRRKKLWRVYERVNRVRLDPDHLLSPENLSYVCGGCGVLAGNSSTGNGGNIWRHFNNRSVLEGHGECTDAHYAVLLGLMISRTAGWEQNGKPVQGANGKAPSAPTLRAEKVPSERALSANLPRGALG